MSDPMSILLAIEPLPRGERLARWSESPASCNGSRWKPWNDGSIPRLWPALASQAGLPHGAAAVRLHARPLRMARERARWYRAQAEASHRDAMDYLAGWGHAAFLVDVRDRKLARLRDKVWRSNVRFRMDATVVRDAAAAVFLDRAALARSIRRTWEHGFFLERAALARKSMHAAGRGVPGAQPGWEE